MSVIALKRALRPGGISTGLIKGESSTEAGLGLVAGYSASGQDVWLPRATHFGPGLVLSAVGARCGKVFQADGSWSVVANTVVLTPQPGHDPRFLWYLTNDENFWEKGGTAQPYVRVPDTLARKVWLPALDKQRAIADYLDSETARIDTLIEKKQHLTELFRERRQAMITVAVTYGTTPRGDEVTSDLWSPPHGWGESRIDRLAEVRARIGWKALTASEYVKEGYIFLSTPNIKQVKIDFENVNYITEFRYEESPELKLRVGDVLLVKDGNTLGITNLVRELPRPATVNGSIAVLRCHSIDSAFLRYVLVSDFIQDRIGAYRAGMGVPHLFQKDIRKFPIPLPPPSTQRAIADYLDRETTRIDSIAVKLGRQIDLLRERRQALITSAVTGELEVPGLAA